MRTSSLGQPFLNIIHCAYLASTTTILPWKVEAVLLTLFMESQLYSDSVCGGMFRLRGRNGLPRLQVTVLHYLGDKDLSPFPPPLLFLILQFPLFSPRLYFWGWKGHLFVSYSKVRIFTTIVEWDTQWTKRGLISRPESPFWLQFTRFYCILFYARLPLGLWDPSFFFLLLPWEENGWSLENLYQMETSPIGEHRLGMPISLHILRGKLCKLFSCEWLSRNFLQFVYYVLEKLVELDVSFLWWVLIKGAFCLRFDF